MHGFVIITMFSGKGVHDPDQLCTGDMAATHAG